MTHDELAAEAERLRREVDDLKHVAGPVDIREPVIEARVRFELEKPEGELTEADLERVTKLVLGGTKITDAGLKEVAMLKQLRTLQLGLTLITDAGLEELAKLEQLERLDLSCCYQITDTSLKELAKLKQLTELGLKRTHITNAGLKEMAKLKQLTRLFLNGTKVTQAGVAVLRKALPNCFIEH